MGTRERTALVTGSGRGIGAGIVRALKADGWTVIGCDLLPRTQQMQQESPVDQFHQVDLSKPDQIDKLYEDVCKEHKELHALVNNAGVHWPIASIEEATVEQFDFINAVNVRAPWLMTKKFVPLLKAAGECSASVVFISSINAMAGPMDTSIYTATKGALNALTRQLAVELGTRYKIRVNAVMPGQTDTPLFRRHMGRLANTPDYIEEKQTPESLAAVESMLHSWADNQSVLNRVGKPDDIGPVVAFLVDWQKSAFVTGDCVLVDGGLMATLVKPTK